MIKIRIYGEFGYILSMIGVIIRMMLITKMVKPAFVVYSTSNDLDEHYIFPLLPYPGY